jgi:uncharacterized protein YwgA
VGKFLSNKAKLGRFLKALKKEGIIDFNKNSFVHRLKLQKYVFIAQKMGFKTDYAYSLYIHGPYSTKLADDYYLIENFEGKRPIRLDKEFVKLIKNKSEKWLELASTIVMIRARYDEISDDKLIALVKTAKHATEDRLMKIISELEKTSCFD